jgi:hypothetical protein
MSRGTQSRASRGRTRATILGAGTAILAGTLATCAGDGVQNDEKITSDGGGGFAGFTTVASGGGAAGGANVAGAAGVAGSILGAGGAAGSAAQPRVYCDAMTTVIQSSCGDVSCHGNPAATIGGWGVDDASVRPYVDKPSVLGRQCGVIIDSLNPNESLILTKVLGTFPDGFCGGPMPVGSFERPTQAQILCLSDWLQQFKR